MVLWNQFCVLEITPVIYNSRGAFNYFILIITPLDRMVELDLQALRADLVENRVATLNNSNDCSLIGDTSEFSSYSLAD